MANAKDKFNQHMAEAKKLLHTANGKLPTTKIDPVQAWEDSEKKLAALDDALIAAKAAAAKLWKVGEEYYGAFQTSEFGLDSDKADGKKTIIHVRKIIESATGFFLRESERLTNELGKLDKALTEMMS